MRVMILIILGYLYFRDVGRDKLPDKVKLKLNGCLRGRIFPKYSDPRVKRWLDKVA
jgi:hypothetical protein